MSVRTPLLAHPTLDAPLAIFTDASDFAIGAVLQHVNGAWQPLEFSSKKLSKAERKYILSTENSWQCTER
jgi:hypothetical protein